LANQYISGRRIFHVHPFHVHVLIIFVFKIPKIIKIYFMNSTSLNCILKFERVKKIFYNIIPSLFSEHFMFGKFFENFVYFKLSFMENVDFSGD
jgi:hypothetical protein